MNIFKNNGWWRVDGEPEIVAFSLVYKVNIIVFDSMSCSTPYLIAENENATYTVYLLMISNKKLIHWKYKDKLKVLTFKR